MRMIIKYIRQTLMTALLLMPLAVGAQPLRAIHTHISTKDGLCSNAISTLRQDGYGYIWIATWNGLSRYDGYEFYNYRMGSASGVKNLHNRLLDIAIDQHENVWMQMYDNRVFVLNRRTDKIINPFEGKVGYEDFRLGSSIAHDKLREAGQIKENYITRFLGDLSAHVATMRQEENRYRKLLKQGRAEDLLHSLSQSSRADDALENFYQIFDKTFLDLYPHFVESFNALLRPEARIELKKEGQLTTELRIFALIRLGIDDSKEIARMLHYSLSTIYNYKVSVKNGALDRDSFEQKVKEIK